MFTDQYSLATQTALADFDNYENYHLVAATIKPDSAKRYYDGFRQENWISATYTKGGAPFVNPPDPGLTRTSTVFDNTQNQGVPNGGVWSGFSYSDLAPSQYVGGEVDVIPIATTKRLYAIQGFDPRETVNINSLKTLMDAYPVQSAIGWRLLLGGGIRSELEWFEPVSDFNWEKLVVNGVVKFSGIASASTILTYRYWARNPYEGHPSINLTADYRIVTIPLVRGEQFTIEMHYPIAQTLVINSASLGQLTPDNSEPIAGYRPAGFNEYLVGSTTYAEYLRPLYPPPPVTAQPDQPPDHSRFAAVYWAKILVPRFTGDSAGSAGGGEIQFDGNVVPASTEYTGYRETYELPEMKYQVLSATNNIWGWAVTEFGYPDLDAQLPPLPLGTTIESLHYDLQPDGDFGTIIMDSPRTQQTLALLERLSDRIKLLEQALESNTYGQDPDNLGEPRVVNLGWLVNEIATKLGIRRKPNGSFLPAAEQAKYKRNRLNSPKWGAGEYEVNGWGKTGYALRHLPTAYKDGFRQDNQYDLVHDIPQLFEALIDQIDLGQGLQHTSEIRIKVGKQTQSYANVGQMMTDLAIRMIEMEALVEKLTVMGIETGNSVRELYPGIGIPVSTKSVSINIGGKLKQVYYPGFQAGKQSIVDRLVAIAMNLGILIGQFMPSNGKASWNPFNRQPKI
jgi:hypothetical protein